MWNNWYINKINSETLKTKQKKLTDLTDYITGR